jgi:hypothetical protein
VKTALIACALVATLGCAASTRETTLNTANLAINAAASGLLAYDKQHQDELAVQGTPEQATAALAAYRAKRAKLNKALTVAVDALIVAVKLNDQPSLDGLSAAVVEVINDYQDLKGIKK